MLAASGGAARFVVVEKTDPLDATAISRVQQLQHDLPALARAAGLPGARFELAGETALTGDSIGSVFADLGRVALAIMAVTLVLLALFLRSLLAPVYLLAASVLAVFATLGLTILIGQEILGFGSLVYFVPFAAGVLLVSLGSDYNVFVVGRIWEEARRRPVANAVAVAVPQASRAITTAGVALAASFAMLAVIPLEQFRQIAIAMALGVVLDAIAVRSLLVPALVALFGRLGMWPGNRRARPAPAEPGGGAGAGRRSVLTGPFQHGQPGLHGRDADPRLVDLERRRLDADHGPPVAERGPQLILADPARPPGPRLTVAEADQVAAAAGTQHRPQAGHVPGAVLVVEDVEHAAVDDRVDGPAQVRQPEHVTDFEASHQAPFGRLLPGPRDGEVGPVDSGRVGPVRSGQQGLLPRAATGVEHPPGQQALLREPHEGRLRSADVPRGGRTRGVCVIPARRRHGVQKYRTRPPDR